MSHCGIYTCMYKYNYIHRMDIYMQMYASKHERNERMPRAEEYVM